MTIGFIFVMGLVAVACLAVITTCLVIMALLKRFEVTLVTIKDLERDMFFDVNRMCDIWTDWYTKEGSKKGESPEKSSRRRHRGGRKHRKNKKLVADILSVTKGGCAADVMISGTDHYEPASSHKKDK